MPLRLDTRKMMRDFERKRNNITAAHFRPELARFAKRTLTTCIKTTPVRDLGTITRNQAKQYDNRVNYIPSVHHRDDPRLVVNDAGESWLFANGRWWAVSYRTLPDDIMAILLDLESERDRRLATPRPQFIAMRAQARFLYRKTWYQVALSLGIQIQVDAGVASAHSRHEPRKEPPKGYGQWRGGKYVLSIVIYNPLLEQESRYKPFNGKAILQGAAATHESAFMGEVAAKLKTLMLQV